MGGGGTLRRLERLSERVSFSSRSAWIRACRGPTVDFPINFWSKGGFFGLRSVQQFVHRTSYSPIRITAEASDTVSGCGLSCAPAMLLPPAPIPKG